MIFRFFGVPTKTCKWSGAVTEKNKEETLDTSESSLPQFASGVIDKTVQLSDGLSKGLGIDLKSLLVGAFGARILEKDGKAG